MRHTLCYNYLKQLSERIIVQQRRLNHHRVICSNNRESHSRWRDYQRSSYSSGSQSKWHDQGEWRGMITRFLPVGLCLVAVMQWRVFRKRADDRTATQLEVDCYCVLPLNTFSRYWGALAEISQPVFLRPIIYGTYAWFFNIDISEANNDDLKSYKSLAEFFVRPLRNDVRPIDATSELVSPCDGRVLHVSSVCSGKVEQVKGITYAIESFLGENVWSTEAKNNDRDYETSLLTNPKENCLYQCVIYLAPGDYHRFHSPTDWTPTYRRHFPGQLLSVNPRIARWVPGLFCLNERAVYVGKWTHGFFSYTPVGATNVGSLRVYFDRSLVTNSRKNKGVSQKFISGPVHLHKGEMIGEFRMGSTIVLLFEAPKTYQFTIHSGQLIHMGESLGHIPNRKVSMPG